MQDLLKFARKYEQKDYDFKKQENRKNHVERIIRQNETTRKRRHHRPYRPWQDYSHDRNPEGSVGQGPGSI